MKYETIKAAARKPVDRIEMMGGIELTGKHRLSPYTAMGVGTNAWLAYKVHANGKAHSHKIIDGDKILMIDPSNEDPEVLGTNQG